MSQVKAANLVNSDASKTATVNDIIDGTAKTKLFSPYALGILAGVDAPALRASLVAAKSGANSDITELSGLTTPLSVAQGGSGKTTEFRKGHIDGLRMVYTGNRGINIEAGSAYIPSSGKIIELSNDKVITGLTPTASTFYHLYLYDNAGVGDIEMSTTAPVVSWGTAYTKSADSSRRYIGSFLTNINSDIWKFRHDPHIGRVVYIYGTPGQAPFVIASGLSNTSASNLDPCSGATMFAPQATALEVLLIQAGNAAILGPVDQGTAAAPSNWYITVGTVGATQSQNMATVLLSRTTATLGKFYAAAATAAQPYSLYGYGYTFER